ncbi:MAG: ArsR/SmtB family transcription factor [Geminicoccaceae bacterium]
MIALEEAAQGFAAVGSEPRLDVLLSLVRAGPDGLSVGEIQERLELPASTLAHHLRFLAAAGLIEQEKQGRIVRNRADFGRIESLADFLLRECCSESGAPHPRGQGHLHDSEDAA